MTLEAPPTDQLLSVALIEAMEDEAERLRHLLKSALRDAAPRLEREVLEGLRTLVTGPQDKYELAVAHHLQEVVASLVMLSLPAASLGSCLAEASNSDALPRVFDPTTSLSVADIISPSRCGHPENVEAAPVVEGTCNVKTAYVSKNERTQCTWALVSLAVRLEGHRNNHVPSSRMIQALYPLLTSTNSASKPGQAQPSQNTIADDLWSRRFYDKKHLIAVLLDTIVFEHDDGVQSLIRTLLFDDRIGHGATLDAAIRISSLLVRLQSPEVLRRDDRGGLHTHVMTHEEHIHSLCQQLNRLLAWSAEEVKQSEEPPTNAFTRMAVAHKRALVPNETLEERLHMVLSLIATKLVELPKRDANARVLSKAYTASYQRLFFTNKYLLSPAFAALTGNHPRSASDVKSSLRKLASLAHGATLSASPNTAWILVWELVADSVVEMTTLLRRHCGGMLKLDLVPSLRRIWLSLAEMSTRREELAFSMAIAIMRPASRKCRFRWSADDNHFESYVGDRTSPSHDHDDEHGSASDNPVTDAAERLASVAEVFLAMERFTTCERLLQRWFFILCKELQRTLYAVGSSEPDSATQAGQCSPRRREALLSQFHALFVVFDSDKLFGLHSTSEVIDLVAILVTLSPLLLHQSLSMLTKLFTMDGSSLWSSLPAVQLQALCPAVRRVLDVVPLCPHGADSERTVEVNQCLSALEGILISMQQRCDALLGSNSGTVSSAGEGSSTPEVTFEEMLRSMDACVTCRSKSQLIVAAGKLHHVIAGGLDHGSFQLETKVTLFSSLFHAIAGFEDPAIATHCVSSMAIAVTVGLLDPELWVKAVEALTTIHDTDTRVMKVILLNGVANLVQITIPGSPLQAELLLARMLDVCLAICDMDDSSGIRCRQLDDACRNVLRGFGLLALLRRIVTTKKFSEYLRVACLHLCGEFGATLYPRVEIQWLWSFATDVFRLGGSMMERSAAASMMSTVAGRVVNRVAQGHLDILADADLQLLKDAAAHLQCYRGAPKVNGEGSRAQKAVLAQSDVSTARGNFIPDDEDAVIRLHGTLIQKHLNALPSLLQRLAGPRDCDYGQAAADTVRWRQNGLNLWSDSAFVSWRATERSLRSAVQRSPTELTDVE